MTLAHLLIILAPIAAAIGAVFAASRLGRRGRPGINLQNTGITLKISQPVAANEGRQAQRREPSMRQQWLQHAQVVLLAALAVFAPAAPAHIANNPPGAAITPHDRAHVPAPGGAIAVRATFAGACDVATRVSEDILSTSREARLVRQKFDCSRSVWTWQGSVAHAAPGDTLDVVLDFEQNGYTRATTHYHGVSATYFVAP